MRGLYAIVDLGVLVSRGADPVAFAQSLLTAKPAALQLRAKFAPPRETLSLLRALVPLCRQAGVPLVANDRPDWAILAGCDMVHVGQSDMPVEQVKRLAPGLRVGVSTHTLAQLEAALAKGVTYVAYGPVFPTTTKVNPDPVVGVDGLREAHRLAQVAGVPLVAIGGITRERAAAIAGLAEAFAVVSDLLPSEDTRDQRTSGTFLTEVASRAGDFAACFGAASRRGAA